MANISENAQQILERRYFIEGETTAEQMFRRVAHHIARVEEKDTDKIYWEEQFFNLMNNLDFLPNSPTLMNAGTKIGNFSACFVLNIEDSIDSIFEFYKDAALVCKAGGGIGASYTKLRPNNESVASTKGVASGPISWMKIQDMATEQMKQGGRRRGANMGVLRIDHPSIEEFIICKDDGQSLQNFNLSIAITDEFMSAVKNNLDFYLQFNGKIYKTVKARELWNQICYHAWLRGDPGLFFIDIANRCNPTPHIGEYESVNVCGEQVLLANEACTLGSINLVNMLTLKNKKWIIDSNKLNNTVKVAIRFLDNVLDCNVYPTNNIEKMAKGNRKIGLGIMGFGDMLYKMRIKYNSDIAIDLAKRIMSVIYDIAKQTSQELGDIKGYFPNDKINLRRRNACLTTIPPTGTISIIADVSSGCEPNFALCYKRVAMSMDNKEFYFINPILQDTLHELGIYTDELIKKIANNNGILKGIEEIPKDIQDVFVTAMEISSEWHIKMQAAFQTNGVDSAVSKTINMSNDATVEDVQKAYMMAYDLGCKGITIFRDGCRGSNQVLSTNSTMPENNQIEVKYNKPQKRKKRVPGITESYQVGCGKIYLTINGDKDGLIETFSNLGANGVCSGYAEGLSRMISLAFRSGIDPNDIIDQLHVVKCPNCKGKKVEAKSCPDAFSKAIEATMKELGLDIKEEVKIKINSEINNSVCPDCGEKLISESGCFRCNCGYSKCS